MLFDLPTHNGTSYKLALGELLNVNFKKYTHPFSILNTT